MPNVVVRFSVFVGVDLGDFMSCEGLGSEYELFDWAEGGRNDFVHHLVGRVKHSNIKLTRGLDERSKDVAGWVSSFEMRPSRQDGVITAYAREGTVLCSWDLMGVAPLKWTGPSFAADGNGIAKETLELTHKGFKFLPGK